jgi:hypothetical protein
VRDFFWRSRRTIFDWHKLLKALGFFSFLVCVWLRLGIQESDLFLRPPSPSHHHFSPFLVRRLNSS